MEYTINEVATLSNVSTRTLRYYDEIGLLKPLRIDDNGYRIYGKKQIDLLQEILFYRELDFKLIDIKTIIYNKSYDKISSLQNHLIELTERKDQLITLINNVQKTIKSIKGGIAMTDKEKFEGFKTELLKNNETKYGKELKQKYGENTMNESNQKFKNMSEEDWNKLTKLQEEFNNLLVVAISKNDPSCDEAQSACQKHKEWLCMQWPKNAYSADAHLSLVDMYNCDERFKSYYDKIDPQATVFLKKALQIFYNK